MSDESTPPAKKLPSRRPTNVTVRADLLEAARAAGINLSATLERALVEDIAKIRRDQWRKENKAGIDSYNEFVDAHGTYSDDVRTF